MTPTHDGSGYGHCMYWRTKMKEIALDKGEICECWNMSEPKINFFGERDEFEMKVECQEKHNKCNKSFELTEKELIAKFKNFYKV